MSFSTTPLAGANIVSPPGAQSQSQQTGRERAIAALAATMQQPQVQTRGEQLPVRNQNQVSPEEMNAIRAPQGQQLSSEAPASPEVPVEASEATAAPAKAPDPLSSHYARLAKNEKLLRAKAQEQKVREDALKAQEAALQAREQEYRSNYISKDSLKGPEALSILAEQGLTYDQLTQLALNAPSQEAREADLRYKALEAKIEELNKAQEESKKSYAEQQNAAYTQAVAQIRQETMDLVRSAPDEYEAIKATRSVGDVVKLIEQTWKRDNVLLSVEEAAREVEDYLVEEATKIARLKKIQQRLAPQGVPAKAPEAPKAGQPQLRTLTNAVGSTRQLSAKERAIAVFRGEKI